MKRFYVYFLCDPRNFYLPFYIGKGSGNRWETHLKESLKRTSNKRKFYKIAKMREEGFEPKVMIWQNDMSEDEAYELEENLILRFGRKDIEENGILMNLCLGARPPGFTHCVDQEAFRKKISDSCKGEKNGFFGKTHSQEIKDQISRQHSGKVISENHRKSMSAKLKNRVKSQETREKMSKASIGKPKSEEHRKKIGDIHRGKTISLEQREKLSKAMKGRKFSPETIEKLKIAARLHHQKKRDNLL